MKNIHAWIIAALIAVLAVFALVGVRHSAPQSFGATNYGTVQVDHIQVGPGCNDANSTCTGTSVAHIVSSTCNLIGTDSSQTASTTKQYDCAVTNLLSTDNVIAQLATTTVAASFGGWNIISAGASTTAGFATVLLYNGTGASAAPSAIGVGSSTKIWAFR